MSAIVKARILNLLLLLSSFCGYLEWGEGNHMFLIEGEVDMFSKLFSDPLSVLHPFTILPMLGQLLLLITVFQKKPSKWFTYGGMAMIGVLFLLMFFIGVIGPNYKILLSVIPFLVISFLIIRNR